MCNLIQTKMMEFAVEDASLSQSVWNQYRVSSVSVRPIPGIRTYEYLLVCLLDKVYKELAMCAIHYNYTYIYIYIYIFTR